MANGLKRGFKTEAEEYAIDFRRELSLAENDPLPALALAGHLDIFVFRLSLFEGIADDIKMRFVPDKSGKSCFSGMVLFDNGARHVLFNDYIHHNRQNSSIMHEIAHIILRHPSGDAGFVDGDFVFNEVQETEANELAYALLIPKRAALSAVEDFNNLQAAADYFGVSLQLLRHRVGQTNAYGWAKNRRA